jgi:predicted nucleotidyltransferase
MDLEQLQGFVPQLKQIAAKYKVKEIFVFGSVARGEDRSSSDLDFLIEMEIGAPALGVGGFQHEVQSLLGVHVDVVPTFALPRVRDQAFVESIRSQAKPL